MQGKGIANQEVLIKWKDLPDFEATWELSSIIQQQFLHFHLEDKVLLLAEGNDKPPICYTYARRGKGQGSRSLSPKQAGIEEENVTMQPEKIL